ncbi:MAG: porin, partial [Tateyamaria sp.]|nr:porin [Tateyamaria sp.]
MKKLLLASTALVATAGMAAAEITFSGSARFGVTYNEGTGAAIVDTAAAGGLEEQLDDANLALVNIAATAATNATALANALD